MPITTNKQHLSLRGEVEFYDDESRINYLANLIEEGSQDGSIREFTLKMLNAKAIKSYDTIGEAKAIFDWVRDNITYRRHILCRDSFQTAPRTLALGSADCDQAAVLTDSMSASIGIPIGLRVVSSDNSKPFHHIYGIIGVPASNPTKWIAMDTTQKQFQLGDEPNYAKKKDWMIICGE